MEDDKMRMVLERESEIKVCWTQRNQFYSKNFLSFVERIYLDQMNKTKNNVIAKIVCLKILFTVSFLDSFKIGI